MDDQDRLVRVQADAVVVTLPVEIDMTNADSVGSDLSAALGPGVKVVVADLTSTVFCDSGGLRNLVMSYHKAAASGAELRLAVRSNAVLRVIELTGILKLMGVYPSVEAALTAEPGTSRA
jgi:anti-sigma B factor antagonist